MKIQIQKAVKAIEQRQPDAMAPARSLFGSQVFLTAVLDTVNALVTVLDPEGCILQFNRAAERITGYSPQEATGKNIWELLLPPEEREPAQAAFEELKRADSRLKLECHCLTKEGSRLLIEWSSLSLQGDDGSVTHLVATGVDITERKRAENALFENQRRLEMALRASNTGLWVWDLRTNEVRFSREWKSQIGYSENEIADRYEEWESRLHPDDLEATVVAVRRHMANPEEEYKVEFRLRHKDGSYRWIRAQGAALKDSEGTLCHMLGSHLDITEQKRVEEALRTSEDKYRSLIANIPGVVWTGTAEGETKFISGNFYSITGFTSDEMLASGFGLWLGRIHLEDRPGVIRANEKLFRQGVPYDLRYRFRTKDGRWIWFHDRSSTPYQRDGKKYVDGIADVITDQMETESSNRLLVTAIEQATDAVVITDAQGTIEYVNTAFSRHTQYEIEEVLGKNPRILKSGKHTPEFYRSLWDTLMAGKVWEGEIVNQKKDGSNLVESMTITPVRDDSGIIRHFIAVKSDITEQRRAEAQARRREADYRQIVETSSDGICLIDPAGKITFVNQRPLEMLGYGTEEVVGCTVFDFVHESDLSEAKRQFINCLQGAREQFDLKLRCKNGQVRQTVIRGAPVYDADGNFLEALVTISDVTEGKKLEEQFRQAQKMEAVGRLAGGVAHDFNNILGVIIGYSDLASGYPMATEPLMRSIGKIKDAALRAASLTRQLLAFSRKQVLETRTLNLTAVVSETAKLLQPLIGEDVELVLSLNPALAGVIADPSQLDQILMNLAVNARDAMPRGGRLTIATDNVDVDEHYARQHPIVPPGPYVLLSVTDNGAGMDQETQQHIFEPFFTTKDKGQGTGLGLATVYGIVKQSAGFIWVYSEPGHGTTFKIYFPVANVPDKPAVNSNPQSAPDGSETILLVEDESMLREVNRALLEGLGYRVLEAGTGAQAIELAERHMQPIQLLMTDVVMPGMNGRELASKLCALQPDLKVLFVSGYTDDVVRSQDLLDTGAHFLQKPFTRDSLANRIRKALTEKSVTFPGRVLHE